MSQSYRVQIFGTRAGQLVPWVQALGCEVERIAGPEQLTASADLALISGVHYIIASRFLRVPRLGIWGFHETDLPKGRGCAPLQWTVLKGEPALTVSLFELAEKVDTGRILGKASAPLTRTMLLEDLRELGMNLCRELLNRCLIPFLAGQLEPQPQTGTPSRYPKRNSADSQLDPARTLAELWDVIRVCDNDSFPAWFEIDGERFILRRFRQE